MSTIDVVQRRIQEEGIEFVDLRVVDLAGRWRHVTIPSERLTPSLIQEGVAFDAPNLGYASVEGSDMVLIPDLATAAVIPVNGDRILTLICNIHAPQTGERFTPDPRAVAERAEAALRAMGVADEICMSPEFEFYVFEDASFCSDQLQSHVVLEPLNERADRSFYHICPPEDQLFKLRNEICRRLSNHGIPIKYHHHEVGAYGQLEIELGFHSLVEAADYTQIIKNTARTVAVEEDLVATFLPKPIFGENGSGLHVHQYLAKGGASVFEEAGELSQLARHYIGGILKHGRSLCALTNPSTNSYRRLVPGYEAPVWFAYGEANRSAAVRIPRYASAAERRMELRTPDATCNPYLAYAAMLMAGLDGIRHKIDAAERGFGPYNENLYDLPDDTTPVLEMCPVNLEDALTCLEEDHEYLLADGVFSKEQIENWIQIKRVEARSVRNRPHPYEFSLYFDL